MPQSAIENFIKQKKASKKMLAEKFSFSLKNPLMAVILDKELSKDEEGNLREILEATSHVNVQVVILADTNSGFNAAFLPYGRANRKILLEASDMALSFKFSDVEEMLLNGTIPISPERAEVKDYNPNHETGNGFIYRKNDRWCIFAALVRAIETFKFPYDWNNIVREGLRSVLI